MLVEPCYTMILTGIYQTIQAGTLTPIILSDIILTLQMVEMFSLGGEDSDYFDRYIFLLLWLTRGPKAGTRLFIFSGVLLEIINHFSHKIFINEVLSK